MTDNNNQKQDQNNKILQEMIKNGVHYGRAKKFTHPSMKEFLLKTNKNIEFFNLKITLEKLNEMADFLVKILKENKKILFVCTNPAGQNQIKEFALTFNQPYINYKWVGGLLTNFKTIQARLIYFKELLKKEESGELNNLSPYERSRIERELQKLKNLYSGIINLDTLPDFIFIVNLSFKQHKTAKREAIKMKIPILALAGTDNNISNVFLFVPGNDKAPKSISWQINYLINKIKSSL
jgi:small subunit ribosomal protein S2